MFRKILIANRGEVALRIARTCRELGIPCVAVYSSADAGSPVTHLADEAVHIGPAPAARSYLNVPALVEAARMTGADAVHPGYGFLAEDPDFAEVCAAEGLTFIGPAAAVLECLGNKASARDLMRGVGVPLLPGGDSILLDEADGLRTAERIGYPVIVKAVAGGGGKGMGVAWDPGELVGAVRDTRAAAQALYSDNRVYLERYLRHARHVELQVLGDRYGAAVHLGDRDCSVQRRHQKLVEETPAPGLSPETRQAMAEAALTGVKAAGLVGAATVEFLVDEHENFYFMEVNPRLQVEHPVTEMVTGVDIVAQQIRLAAGEPLALEQSSAVARGAAVECRLNAEDPDRDFLPTPGRLDAVRLPAGPFTRVDTHVAPGTVVTADYDSLLGKIVVWGPDRTAALARMDRALAEVVIEGSGIRHTRDLLRQVLRSADFAAGRHSTDLLTQLLGTAARPAGDAGAGAR
ncbi:biotin carboxylase N-terminal domain-containing protein [Micromonospora sp. NPDC049101]|uniref:acetyl-CoA carboxylase biotin carboxylase subunit n=1 Tax=unclassified Micromonospora TaxID=2617518 RepID=UPI0033C19293